jgi:DNA polymerase V
VATYTTRAAEKLRRQNGAAKLVNVFVVTNDHDPRSYEYHPRTHGAFSTLPQATSLTHELIGHAVPLVEQLFKEGSRYLKAGVMLGEIVPQNAVQYNLFELPENNIIRGLMGAVDNVNFSMRDDVVKFAAAGTKKNWKMRQEYRSKRHSSRWEELYVVK